MIEIYFNDLWDIYLPFAVYFILYSKFLKNDRLIIGVCGSGGGGKTTFSAILKIIIKNIQKDIINRYYNIYKDLQEIDTSYIDINVLSMDAYHYNNEELKEMNLIHKKGSPESFDIKSFVDDLTLIHSTAENHFRVYENPSASTTMKQEILTHVYLPEYDRKLHNPIGSRIEIKSTCKIVIVEGLYLLLYPEVAKQINFHIKLNTSWSVCRQRLLRRRLKSRNEDEKTALEYIDRVDYNNYNIITNKSATAHIYLNLDANIEYKITTVPKLPKFLNNIDNTKYIKVIEQELQATNGCLLIKTIPTHSFNTNQSYKEWKLFGLTSLIHITHQENMVISFRSVINKLMGHDFENWPKILRIVELDKTTNIRLNTDRFYKNLCVESNNLSSCFHRLKIPPNYNVLYNPNHYKEDHYHYIGLKTDVNLNKQVVLNTLENFGHVHNYISWQNILNKYKANNDNDCFQISNGIPYSFAPGIYLQITPYKTLERVLNINNENELNYGEVEDAKQTHLLKYGVTNVAKCLNLFDFTANHKSVYTPIVLNTDNPSIKRELIFPPHTCRITISPKTRCHLKQEQFFACFILNGEGILNNKIRVCSFYDLETNDYDQCCEFLVTNKSCELFNNHEEKDLVVYTFAPYNDKNQNHKVLFVSRLVRDLIFPVNQYAVEDQEEAIKNPPRISKGGNGCNSSVVINRLGNISASFMSAVATDSDDLLNSLKDDDNIDVSHCVKYNDENITTPTSYIWSSSSSGSRTIYHYKGNLPELSISDFEHVDFGNYDLVHFEVRPNTEVIRQIILNIRHKYNPPPLISLEFEKIRDNSETLYELGDVMFFSKDYVKLQKQFDVTSFMEYILNKTNRKPVVVVPFGSLGAYAQNDIDEILFQPAVAVNVVDTVGAGDTFIATFLRHFLMHKNDLNSDIILEALKTANEVAAKKCARHGIV